LFVFAKFYILKNIFLYCFPHKILTHTTQQQPTTAIKLAKEFSDFPLTFNLMKLNIKILF